MTATRTRQPLAPRGGPTLVRAIDRLANDRFDLAIVGAGIYGITAAWHAARRGLNVALIDRGDFCCATSANSLKLVHGGFRYMQHLDVARIRDSVRQRRFLLRIAPHLVHPIPFVIPTYGHGMRGKEVLLAGLALYNLLAYDRNRGIMDPDRRIPWGSVLSRDGCLRHFPHLAEAGLTGGVAFYDGQMYNPPRLALTFVKSAVQMGAVTANYVAADGLAREGRRVVGVEARDTLTGDAFTMRADVVLNSAGPWAGELLRASDIRSFHPPLAFSKDVYLVTDRRPTSDYALCVESRYADPNAKVSRGARHYFVIPWRDYTLIGSSHATWEGTADEFAVEEGDIQSLVDEINHFYPGFGLRRSEVRFSNGGLVPMGDNEPGAKDLRLAQRYRIVDHEIEDDVPGLFSVMGVRWTTAGDVGERVVDRILGKLKGRNSGTTPTPARVNGFGGSFRELRRRAAADRPGSLPEDILRHLLRNHGPGYATVLEVAGERPELLERLPGTDVLGAEVVHAVDAEMAHTLSDVVFRRTDIGTAGHPGTEALRQVADLTARRLGWDAARTARELDDVLRVFE